MLDCTTVSLYSYIWTQRDDLYQNLKTVSVTGGVKLSACQQGSLCNKFVPICSTDYINSVSQVYAGTMDIPSSLLLCGDSNATRISRSFCVHSDSHRHRQVSNINYTACVYQSEQFLKQIILYLSPIYFTLSIVSG